MISLPIPLSLKSFKIERKEASSYDKLNQMNSHI